MNEIGKEQYVRCGEKIAWSWEMNGLAILLVPFKFFLSEIFLSPESLVLPGALMTSLPPNSLLAMQTKFLIYLTHSCMWSQCLAPKTVRHSCALQNIRGYYPRMSLRLCDVIVMTHKALQLWAKCFCCYCLFSFFFFPGYIWCLPVCEHFLHLLLAASC